MAFNYLDKFFLIRIRLDVLENDWEGFPATQDLWPEVLEFLLYQLFDDIHFLFGFEIVDVGLRLLILDIDVYHHFQLIFQVARNHALYPLLK